MYDMMYYNVRMSKIYAVHFLDAKMRPVMGTGRKWRVGETRTVRGTLVLCHNGFHYCPTWAAALEGNYLYGPMACIVEVEDSGPHDDQKGCSRTRTLVEAYNVERKMRLYGANEASRGLKAWEAQSGQRALSDSWRAIDTIYALARGTIDATRLTAAHSAAYSAAYWAAYSGADLSAPSAYSATIHASAKRFAAVMGKATGWYDQP